MLSALAAILVFAQTTLPPPPPPPLDTSNRPPPPPPDTSGSHGSSGSSRDRDRKPPPAHHEAQHVEHDRSPPPEQPPPPAPARERDLSLRLNPLPLFEGRLSVDGEWMFAPHHALIASPHFTFSAPRFDLAAYAFGFAPRGSSGVGTEVGYHYWLERRLEGFWLGPSVIFGFTSPPSPIKSFGYFGAAMDLGYQLVFEPGFTLDFGGGVMVIDATPAGTPTKVAPRALFGIGWTF